MYCRLPFFRFLSYFTKNRSHESPSPLFSRPWYAFPPYAFDNFAGVTTEDYSPLQTEFFSLAMTIYQIAMDKPHVNKEVLSPLDFEFKNFVTPYLPMKNASASVVEAKRDSFFKAYEKKILIPLYADLDERMPELGDTNGAVSGLVKALTRFTKYTPQQKDACFCHFATQDCIALMPEPTADA